MNYEVIISGDRKPIKTWTKGVPVEAEAKQQLLNMAELPFIYRHIAVMPDVHLGAGATIGSVIPTQSAVIPAAVGVDIGCGVLGVRTSMTSNHLSDNLKGIRSAIEAAVPHGRTDNGGPNDRGAWGDLPERVVKAWEASFLREGFDAIVEKHPKIAKSNNIRHLGTLGTGNHFIEMCLDQDDRVWFMLHSGSRGVGNKIGSYFIGAAKAEMKRWYISLTDPNLAYLPKGTQLYKDYLDGVEWAQGFASLNRTLMMEYVIEAVTKKLGLDFGVSSLVVNCHHNYVAWESHFGQNVIVTRKGAIRAREDDLGIIPGSMGAKSFIIRGKGNPESFNSCAHGAGRLMSRTAARKKFSVADHEKATTGIECRKDGDVLDETPGSYKDIDAVMKAQEDLVEVLHTLRQVVCVKG